MFVWTKSNSHRLSHFDWQKSTHSCGVDIDVTPSPGPIFIACTYLIAMLRTGMEPLVTAAWQRWPTLKCLEGAGCFSRSFSSKGLIDCERGSLSAVDVS